MRLGVKLALLLACASAAPLALATVVMRLNCLTILVAPAWVCVVEAVMLS